MAVTLVMKYLRNQAAQPHRTHSAWRISGAQEEPLLSFPTARMIEAIWQWHVRGEQRITVLPYDAGPNARIVLIPKAVQKNHRDAFLRALGAETRIVGKRVT